MTFQSQRLPHMKNKILHTCTAAFCLALLIQLGLYQAGLRPDLFLYADMAVYFYRGMRFAQGLNLLSKTDLFFPPAISVFYAPFFLFFSKIAAMRAIWFAQACLLASAPTLTALLSLTLFPTREREAQLIAILAAIFFPALVFSGFFLTEPLFIFLLLLALLQLARAWKTKNTISNWFLAGLLSGLAFVVRSHGGGILLAGGFAAFKSHKRLAHLTALMLGFFLILSGQFALNSKIAGEPALYVSTNDAFNIYLGQSRLRGTGCVDPKTGHSAFFFNNNSSFESNFEETQIVECSMEDRPYFFKRSWDLWQENPARQILHSLKNLQELFALAPEWPLRNAPRFYGADRLAQTLVLFFISLPALHSIVVAFRHRKNLDETIFLLLPVVTLFGLIALASGQSRYFLPFRYLLIVFAAPVLCRWYDWFRSDQSE